MFRLGYARTQCHSNVVNAMTIGERERHYSNFHSSLSAESQLLEPHPGSELSLLPLSDYHSHAQRKRESGYDNTRRYGWSSESLSPVTSPSWLSSSTPLSFFFASHCFIEYVAMTQCTYPYTWLHAVPSCETWPKEGIYELFFSLVPLREGKYPS